MTLTVEIWFLVLAIVGVGGLLLNVLCSQLVLLTLLVLALCGVGMQ